MKIKIRPFDLYIFLITMFKGFGASGGDKLYIAAFAFGCFSVFMKMIQEKYTQRELLSMMFIVMVGLADFLFGNETTILFTAVAICGMKNVDTERLIKIVFWTRLVTFSMMIIGSVIGVVDDGIHIFYRDGGFLNRHNFGYGHPNIAHMAFTIIIMLMLYLYGTKLKIAHYIGLVICNYVLFYFTYSRTGLLLGNLSILFWVALQFPKLRKPLMRYGKHGYVLLFLFSLAVALLYGHIGYLDKLNETLSGRIAYMSYLVKNFIPPIIGSDKYNQYIIIDNGYFAMIYHGGVLAFGWISYYVMKLERKLTDERRFREFFLITCFIMYSFTESFFPSISVNIALLLIGEVLFGNGGCNNESVNGVYANIQPEGKT